MLKRQEVLIGIWGDTREAEIRMRLRAAEDAPTQEYWRCKGSSSQMMGRKEAHSVCRKKQPTGEQQRAEGVDWRCSRTCRVSGVWWAVGGGGGGEARR